MNLDTINVLCATDDNYAPYCGIMLTSLFENNKDCQFRVSIFLSNSLSAKNQRKLKSLESKYKCAICPMFIPPEITGKFEVNRSLGIHTHTWVTSATFFRLLAADLLPKEIHKVLYLDCDIVINDSILELWDLDLNEVAFAGVLDDSSEYNCNRLGYSPEDYYMNAGVALYNLDYWRKNRVTSRLFDYMSNNHDKITLMDQDIINGTLHGTSLRLPERYNFLVTFFDRMCWERYPASYRERILEESDHAVIIHYCGRIKPWDYKYIGSPFWNIWDKYRKISNWREARITTPRMTYIKTIVKSLLLPKYIERKQALWIKSPFSRLTLKDLFKPL